MGMKAWSNRRAETNSTSAPGAAVAGGGIVLLGNANPTVASFKSSYQLSVISFQFALGN
jgi:hypothetical protein